MKHIAFDFFLQLKFQKRNHNIISLYMYIYFVLCTVCVLLYMHIYIYIYNVCVCHSPLGSPMERASIIYCTAIVEWI